MQKAYLDTNILVDRVFPLGNPWQHEKATRIFNDCKAGKYLGVISTLTLTEFAGVCQRGESHNFAKIATMTSQQRSQFVQDEGKKSYERLIPTLLSLPYIKLEEGKNLDHQNMLEKAREIMLDTSGTVTTSKDPSTSLFTSDYKRAYLADILHVLLAKHTGCDNFITFDFEITRLGGHRHVDPVQIIRY